MAEAAIGGRARVGEASRASAESHPSEGWITLLLHVLIIAITANSLVRIDQDDRSSVLVPVAIGGLLVGYLLARASTLDAASHLVAVLSGAALTLSVGALRSDGLAETWQRRGLNLAELAERLIRSQVGTDRRNLSDDELLLMVAVTLWLVAYSSAWMLYRRHWLAPALMVPAAVVFVSVRFDEEGPARALAAFVLASLVMAARHHAFVRQSEWARARVPVPVGLPTRFTASGVALALAAFLAGWVLPYQAPNAWVDGLADRVDGVWQRLADDWEQLRGNAPGDRVGGSFSSFDDSFRIGEEFIPSDEPVASLSAAEPSYLVARRYDVYDGTTWSSGVDETFRMEGEGDDVGVTSVTFEPNQSVPLTENLNQSRDRTPGEITVIRDKGGLIYTLDTFAAANLPTVTVMGWKQLNNVRIDLATVDLASIPVDLQSLVRTLAGAEFRADPGTGKPVVASGRLASDIEVERAKLLLLPVRTALEFDEYGKVVLIVSGRVPNYDDIETVFAAQSRGMPARYRVTGSASVAGEEQLRGAGEDYPAWVVERYLQLPPSVTGRTVRLAEEIVAGAGATNSFDAAWAIQQYLRETYQYAENSQRPPDDGDAVDFFLFEKQIGRCEDYAGAMVIMLRAQGIPARLVGGYRTGDELTASGEFLYLEKQAHTWVEAYFPGYGWVPFEPTIIQPPFDYDGDDADAEQPEPSLPELTLPTPTPEPAFDPSPTATPAPAMPGIDSTDADSSLGERIAGGLTWVTLAFTGIFAAAVGVLMLAWAWGLRGLSPGAALYAKALRVGKLWGVQTHPTMTPREFAGELGQAVPRAQRAVAVVAELYSAERYGGIEVSDEVKGGGQQAWRSLRSAVLRWRPWRRKGR